MRLRRTSPPSGYESPDSVGQKVPSGPAAEAGHPSGYASPRQVGRNVPTRVWEWVRTGWHLALTSVAVVTCLAAVMVCAGLVMGYRPVVITSGSMGDTAPPGSLIVARPVEAPDVANGDVLVMRRIGEPTITHRVIEVTRDGDRAFAVTKGDANASADTSPYPLSGPQLVARWMVPGFGDTLVTMRRPGLLFGLGALVVLVGCALAIRSIWQPRNVRRLKAVGSGVIRRRRRRRRRSRVAVFIAVVTSSSGLAWALLTSAQAVGGNVFSTAPCFDAQLAAVHKGQVVHSVSGTVSAPIPAVTPASSFLLFSVRSNANEPADSMVMGRLANPTTVEFTRVTDAGVPPSVTVDWAVVSYSCGVSVQRGTTAGSGTDTVDLPIVAVDPAASFATVSSHTAAAATDADGSTMTGADLTSSTNLRLSSDPGTALPAGSSYSWQVISFTAPGDAVVRTGSTTLGVGVGNGSIALSGAVDPGSTFILAHVTSAGGGADMGSRMVRAHLSSSTTVDLQRLATTEAVSVSVRAVSLSDGTTVHHGTVDFLAGQPSRTVTIPAVDTARTTAMSTVAFPGLASGGSSDQIADDVPGEGSATFTVTDPVTVTVQRAATTGAASFGWQAISWGGPGWWDPTYRFRQRIDVTAGAVAAPDDYTVPLVIDHAALVTSGLARSDGNDLRVLMWDGAAWTELDRVLDEATAWNTAGTTIWFRTRDPIPATTDISYWLYYGNPAPGAALADPEQVYLLSEGFESGTLGDFTDRTGGTGWYVADPWTGRIPLTIDGSQVTAPLTDFPVLVRLTSPALSASAQADGDDIRFTAADGTTPLAHEIESYDSGTGALVAWVRLPAVASGPNTSFYLYFGAPNAPDQSDPETVWATGFDAVWHLARDPGGTAPQLEDATDANRDGLSAGGMGPGDVVAGVSGPALDLDGVDDELSTAPFDPTDIGLRVSAWVEVDDATVTRTIVGSPSFTLGITPGGPGTYSPTADVVTAGPAYGLAAPPVGAGWHHLVLHWTSNQLKVYVDGVLATQMAGAAPAAAPTGTIALAPDNLDGRLDEVRISAAVSDAVIAAEYANQRPGSTLVSAGATEVGSWLGQGTWSARKPLTVDPSVVSGALTDFPLLVQITDLQIAGAAQADADDIVFTSADGTTRLDHQIEDWNPGTGALTAWVRLPSVDDVTGASLFVYYGAPGAVDQQDPTGVFGPNADAVIHLTSP